MAYLTAGELAKRLLELPSKTPVISQRDPEGNGYSPTQGVELALWVPLDSGTAYDGDVFVPERDKEYMRENGINDAIEVIVIVPRY